jgi:hypothetical protein
MQTPAPFKALEESGFSAGVIGLRRELPADLVASAGQQVPLRLSARIVAIGFCRGVKSMIAGRESWNANRAFGRGDHGFDSRWIKPARLAFQAR